MNHTERIQDLSLCIPDTGISSLDSKLLSSCALRIQRLSIVYQSSKWHSVLFNGDTPVLRTLELRGYTAPWSLFKLNSLTTLHLDQIGVLRKHSMEEFLAILSDMQDLRHLYLEDGMARPHDFLLSDVFNAFPKINLPSLSGPLVIAPLSMVVAFLSCINIPPKTEFRLECLPDFDVDFCNIFTLLSSYLAQRSTVSALSCPPIRLLAIEYDRWALGLCFSASSEHERIPIVISRDHWGCNIPLKIVISSPREITDDSIVQGMMTGSRDRITSDMCCSVPFTNVQTVHVLNPPFSSAIWKNALGRLQNLRSIKLSDGYMPDLAPVLSLTPHEPTENQGGHVDRGPNQLFAPALEELELSDIKFSPNPASNSGRAAADLQSLYDALSTRKESRGRLAMTRCNTAGGSSDWKEECDMLGGGWVVTSI